MLDNLDGSSGEISDAVSKLQEARSGEGQESEQNLPTDETVVDGAQDASEGYEEEGEVVELEDSSEGYDEEPELFTVKVGGKEREVSFDQLLENYSKGEDYTNKTMSLADERKALEAERASHAKVLEAEKEKVTAAMQKLSGLIEEQDKAIDWEELRDTDPSEYLRQKEIQQSRKQALDEARSEEAKALEGRRNEAIATESKRLLDAVGDEWKDEKVRGKEIQDIYSYIENRGITEAEFPNIIDHRFWVIARDAMKYQQLQKTGSAVKKQVKNAPKTVKSGRPGKRIQREVDNAKASLRKSGGVDDAVALLRSKRNK